MTIPSPTFTVAGLMLPTEAQIKAGVWQAFQTAFGGALNESDATPQGQLVTSITAALGAANDLLLQYVNLVDPPLSSGRMQDALGRIYFLTRLAAQPTTVTATCVGASGTVIPAGSLALATDGTIYASLGDATIPGTGSIAVEFAAQTKGPISCPAGALNTIYRVIPGWDSITNPADGVLGSYEETPAQFEGRRAASVAANATGILPAVRGAVLAVSGVTDAYVTENTTGSTVTIGGVSIAAHSLYVCVNGGTDANVARAIWTKKPPGCAYNGSTSVSVQDSSSGYTPPYPAYTVSFQRPTPTTIYFAVSIANSPQVPADATSLIQQAILAAFAGDDGGARATIGSTIYALRFAAAVTGLGSWARLISLAIGTTSTPTATSVTLNIDQIPVTSAADIAVTLA